MKTKQTFTLFLMTSIIVAMGLSSCTADDDIAAFKQVPANITNGKYPISHVNVLQSGIVKMEASL